MTALEIGRLLRAGTTGFVAGCRVNQIDLPSFGCLVRADLDEDLRIYGLVHDIRIDDDGLVRQLVTADGVDENIIADNRVNRNVPLEMSVLSVGYGQRGRIFHLLPPRPPLSLDKIILCDLEEMRCFTSSALTAGSRHAPRFGYFRHVLRSVDLPVGELLAAHIAQTHAAHCDAGDYQWASSATQELIVLLRDDYATLMMVLSALNDAIGEDLSPVRL
jgi:hypothetical protein